MTFKGHCHQAVILMGITQLSVLYKLFSYMHKRRSEEIHPVHCHNFSSCSKQILQVLCFWKGSRTHKAH